MIDDDYEGTDYTCITFTPDWKRFHMTGLEADTIALLKKVWFGCTAPTLDCRMGSPFRMRCSGFHGGAPVCLDSFRCRQRRFCIFPCHARASHRRFICSFDPGLVETNVLLIGRGLTEGMI